LALQARSSADSAVTLVGYGVQPEAQGIYVLESGADLTTDDTTGVVLGLPAATQLGASVGDTLRLFGRLDPQTATPGAEVALVVRGTVRFLYDARDQPSVALGLGAARRLAGPAFEDRASVLMVRVAEGLTPAAVAARLQREWPAVGINSVDDLVAQF